MICSEFRIKDIFAVKRMIEGLKSCLNQDECNLDLCQKFICSEYEEDCDSCMFYESNNVKRLSCEDTIGVFEDTPIKDIIKRLEFIYSQLYISKLNYCKKFKSGGKNVI